MDKVVAAIRSDNTVTLTIVGTKGHTDSSFDTFVVYVIKGNVKNQVFEISRRFKQFKVLDTELRAMFPNESLPEIPRKGFFRSAMDKGLINSRIQALQRYLEFITQNISILKSTPVISWLSPQNNPHYLPLDDPDCTGDLIKQGHVVRNWKNRFFLLKLDMLYYFRTRDDLSPLRVIPLSDASIESAEKMRPLCFKLTPAPQSKLQPFFIQAASKKEYERWVRALEKAVKTPKRVKLKEASPRRLLITPPSLTPPKQLLMRSDSAMIPSSSHMVSKNTMAQSYTDISFMRMDQRSITMEEEKMRKPKFFLTRSHKDLATDVVSRRTGSEGELECLDTQQQIRLLNKQVHDNIKLTAVPLKDELNNAKDLVDENLLAFIKSMNLEIVKSQFLDEASSYSDETLVRALKDMASEFLALTVEDLCEGDVCTLFVKQIQHLSLEYPGSEYRKYITMLLFLVSRVSRLVLIQRSKKRGSDQVKIHGTKKEVEGKQNFPAFAISRCLKILLGGMGISFIDTLQQTQTKEGMDKALFKNDAQLTSLALSKGRSSPIRERRASIRKNTNNLLELSRMKSNPVLKTNQEITNVECAYCHEKIPLIVLTNHKLFCQPIFDSITPFLESTSEILEDDVHATLLSDLASSIKLNVSKLIHKKISLLEKEDDASRQFKELEANLLVLSQLLEISMPPYSMLVENKLLLLSQLKENNAPCFEVSIFVFATALHGVLRKQFNSLVPKEEGESSKNGESTKIKKKAIITTNNFEVVKPISRGAFGRVDLVKRKGTKELELYAMKTLRKDAMIDKNLVEQVMAERDILASAVNPYVVKTYQAFQTSEKLYLLMEYLPGGDCASLLENISYFDEDMARLYIAETIMALDYLHDLGIIHRDVKPDNLLISADGHIKLTDFGLSLPGMLDRSQTNSLNESQELEKEEEEEEEEKELSDTDQKPQRVVGTPDYLAPEALLGTGGGKPSIDWWSVGITLFEFLTGIPPFNDETPEKIFQHILDCDIPWPIIPEEMSEIAKDLIEKLLNPNQDERLGAKGVHEIKSHPFFRDVNWETLYLEPRTATFVPRFMDEFDTGYFVPRHQGEDSFAGVDLIPRSGGSTDKLFAGYSFNQLPSQGTDEEEEEDEEEEDHALSEAASILQSKRKKAF